VTLSRETVVASLIDLMSEISEDHYCAGWMSALEYDLFGIVVGDRLNHYGLGPIDVEKIQRLRELADELDGWVHWTDDGEKFIAKDEWLKLYAPYRADQLKMGWWPCTIGWCVKHHPEQKDKPYVVMGVDMGVNRECGA